MGRFCGRSLALALFVLAAFTGYAEGLETVATRCDESEIVLDSRLSVASLGRCGEGAGGNLLWHLDRIDQTAGSLDGRFVRRGRGAGIVIYVVDTGVMSDHEEFAVAGGSRVSAGFDVAGTVPFGASTCTSPNKATAPCFRDYGELPAASHGTSVASIAAGRRIGVAPGATIVSIRVMNERGLATTRTYMDGLEAIIRDAWSRPAPVSGTSVVNISGWVLDHLTSSRLEVVVPYGAVEKRMRDMIAGVDGRGRRDAFGRKFLFVVAGNNLDGGCGASGIVDRFPATLGRRIPGMITVGGMTPDNNAWAGSCRGGVEVLAPAQGIFSATITAADQYRGRKPNMRSGTSFAAPVISGIAAQMLEAEPDLTPEELEDRIVSTPSRVAYPDPSLAEGRVAAIVVVPTQQASRDGRLAP